MPHTDSPQRRRSAGGTNENAQGKRSLAQASPRRSPPQKQRAALSALSPQQFGENPPLTAEHDTFGRSPLRGPSVQPVGPTQRGTLDARLCLPVYRRAYADVVASSRRRLSWHSILRTGVINPPYLPLPVSVSSKYDYIASCCSSSLYADILRLMSFFERIYCSTATDLPSNEAAQQYLRMERATSTMANGR